jgi:iron complex outermembrane recepter protein
VNLNWKGRRVAHWACSLAAWAGMLPAFAVAEAMGDDTLEAVIVTGAKMTESNKSSTPLLETPQNIQVLSANLLIDQGDHLLDEALRNVAGVMPGGYYTGFDYFRIRGFDASGYIYQDGLLYDSGISTNAELFGLEQVEVVKGPASSLYGQGSLGGLVNLVSKRPQHDAFLTMDAGYGSFDSYQFTLDGGAPLDSSGNVTGRLVAVARRDGSFIDYVTGDTRLYVAPSLTWQIDADTALTLLTSVQHDKMNLGFPLPAEGTVFESPYGYVPLSRYNGEPGRSNNLSETRARVGYEFSHIFNDVFSIQQNFRYSWAHSEWDTLLYPAYLDDSSALVLYRYPYGLDNAWNNLNIDTHGEARFSTGALTHTVTAGVDYYRYAYTADSAQIDYGDPAAYMPLDLIHPVYGGPISAYSYFEHDVDHSQALGLYVQDHAKWDRLTMTVGVRWDMAKDDALYGTAPQYQEKHAVIPRVGFTCEIVPGTVAYTSYSESFKPQLGYSSATGGALDPETGRQWEAGIKTEAFDGRLNATAAVYQLSRQNVATSDPALPPGSGAFLQTGEQRSRGFELDSQVILAKGWELIASYSYIDARVTKDNDIPVGDRSLNVPPQSGGLWMKYEFDQRLFAGLALSAGLNTYSRQWGDLPNTFQLPAYTLVNGNISYARGRFTAQLNLKNLTNERYFVGSYNSLYVNPGASRSAMLNVGMKY